MDVLVLSQIWGEMVSAFSHSVWYCCWFVIYSLYDVRNVLGITNLWGIFNMRGDWVLSNAFSFPVEMGIWFPFFLLVWFMCIYLRILNHPCISRINLSLWHALLDVVLGFNLLVFWGWLQCCLFSFLLSHRVVVTAFSLHQKFQSEPWKHSPSFIPFTPKRSLS